MLIVIASCLQMTGSIIVINNGTEACHVFVSKYSNAQGSDDWYQLGPGQSDTWSRSGWELVAFKNDGDTNRAGRYVRADTTVTFDGLGNITVS